MGSSSSEAKAYLLWDNRGGVKLVGVYSSEEAANTDAERIRAIARRATLARRDWGESQAARDYQLGIIDRDVVVHVRPLRGVAHYLPDLTDEVMEV